MKVDIIEAINDFSQIPNQLVIPNEAVFCLRLHPDATAKSYDPVAIFSDSPQLKRVGSRAYKVFVDDVAKSARIQKIRSDAGNIETAGRLVFLQTSIAGIRRFCDELDRPESKFSAAMKLEIQRIERFDLLQSNERVMGFSPDWIDGRVELVFHPSSIELTEYKGIIYGMLSEAGIDIEACRFRKYLNGPTFVSCPLNRKGIDVLQDVNPLRSMHPLDFDGIPDVRNLDTAPAPKPSTSTTKSAIKVGMFDGGLDVTLPHLAGHAEEDASFSVSSQLHPMYMAHGSAVAGAILYGELNSYDELDCLPPPNVSVVSFKALPTSDTNDIDLYESIDLIEKVVPARKDICVYNISFGPRGPILDDSISRFTYALDYLSVAHRVLFVVAVGNDGEQMGFDRIQSPSDSVHSIGVGAFSSANGKSEVAAYSCKGPGRECGKIKPDVAAFGGCIDNPFHMLSSLPGRKIPRWGTSFASPLVASIGAQAAAMFDRSSPLLARALIIHTAKHPEIFPDGKLGHGLINRNINEMLTCSENSVTVAFQNDIAPRTSIRLPVPLPINSQAKGLVKITWTIVGLPSVDCTCPAEYTTSCIEDVFYPSSTRFSFTSPDKKKRKVLDTNLYTEEASLLVSEGWTKSLFPVSDSGNQYKYELDRRAIDCKWEPIVKRETRKRVKSLSEPFITLQCIGRGLTLDRMGYAALITVDVEEYSGDLYTDVRSQYPALSPIRLRTEAETRIVI